MPPMLKPAAYACRAILLPLVAVAALLPSGCDLLTFSQTGRHIREGNDAVQRGEVQRAVQHYESALDGTMLSAEAHYRLGLLYEDQLKNEVGALHHFERYLELAPQGQFSTDVKTYVQRLRLTLVSRLAEGTVIPAREASRLKNENLELRQQLTELHKEKTPKPARATAAAVPAAPPAMIVAATPRPAAAPVATPEPEVRRALPVGAPPSPSSADSEPVSVAPVAAATAAPAAAAAAPAVGAGQTYTVQKGDTLAAISRKFYKSPAKWQKIADANKDVFPDPTKLQPGMVLKIPE
jgi:LysM repeat protein